MDKSHARCLLIPKKGKLNKVVRFVFIWLVFRRATWFWSETTRLTYILRQSTVSVCRYWQPAIPSNWACDILLHLQTSPAFSFLSLLLVIAHALLALVIFSLVSFLKKKKTYKMGSRCVCVCVSVSVSNFGPPPINFQTSYPIDTKFWLHIVSYRNSPTPLISFLNFENCARENFFEIHFFSI